MSDVDLSPYVGKSALQLGPMLRSKPVEELNTIKIAAESASDPSVYTNLITKLKNLIAAAPSSSSSTSSSSGSAAALYNSTSSSSSSAAAAETMYGIFTPQFIEAIESHKNAGMVVGEGASGIGSIVRKITFSFYVKMIGLKANDELEKVKINREISTSLELTKLIPRCVTKCIGGYVRSDKAYIVYEYLYGITLDKVSNHLAKYPEDGEKGKPYDKQHIFDSLRGCVLAMHANGYVHRDLKPDNVFCCFNKKKEGEEGEEAFTHCILIDFGETQRIGDTPRPIAGNGNPLFHNKAIDEAQEKVTPAVDLFALAKIATNPTDRLGSDGSLGINKESLRGDSMIAKYLDIPYNSFEGGRRRHKRSSKTRNMKRKSKHTRKGRRRN